MEIVNIALGGMEAAQGNLQKAAGRIAKAVDPEADAVDLNTEMVALLAARNQFASNARVVQTGDEMSKMLLDVWG
jgi:flagellar hook protein FlgE